ncbi:hypothetical protein [Chitinophaga rhizosphaerae]|uniref:hypothetical protein n=1 Tax=Chitinophaga rhizosphaerae TaxID=1864947 RepID=UPI000F815B57|nr:hypothetical protein [Chitinophaga rhizosphaerae]
MERILCFPLIFSAMIFSQCSKPQPENPGDPPGNGHGNGGGGGRQNGAPMPKGTPNGKVYSKKIGMAGGTIEYPGARLTINIPAGAVDQETEFFIQPITNTAPGGKGIAYRLQPEGVTFRKPATLKFRYTADDLQATFAAALGIATQKADGAWYGLGAIQNEAAKTLEVKTTHFSDWSFFEAISLEPGMSAADPGQQVPLVVKCVLPGDDDLLVPLTKEGQETALLDPKTHLDAKFIEKWTLLGTGQLASTGNSAKYTAPAKIPATNPVVVSVNVKSNGRAVGILIARVFVAPEGISVSIAGGDYTTYGNSGGRVTTGESFATAQQGGVTASVKWQGKTTGQFSWDATNILFLLNIGTTKTYAQVYNSGGKAVPSPGKLHVVETGNFGWMLGSFELEKSGYYIFSTPPTMGTTKINGYFRVKRLNIGTE